MQLPHAEARAPKQSVLPVSKFDIIIILLTKTYGTEAPFRRTSAGRPIDVRRTSVGRPLPTDVCQTSDGRPSDVRVMQCHVRRTHDGRPLDVRQTSDRRPTEFLFPCNVSLPGARRGAGAPPPGLSVHIINAPYYFSGNAIRIFLAPQPVMAHARGSSR